jgi:hypothetical protein
MYCYSSVPHALRFTKDGKRIMPHPVFYARVVIIYALKQRVIRNIYLQWVKNFFRN